MPLPEFCLIKGKGYTYYLGPGRIIAQGWVMVTVSVVILPSVPAAHFVSISFFIGYDRRKSAMQSWCCPLAGHWFPEISPELLVGELDLLARHLGPLANPRGSISA